MKIVCEERTDEGLRFFKDGCCGTIRTIDGGGDKRVIEVNVIGQMDNTIDNTFESANRVYGADGLSPTINTCGGGGLQPKVIVASRGRNPQNPSDRTPGNYVEQRLEPNSEGICNTLTSVQKDNMVLEPQIKRVDIPQTVIVRKYDVDCKLLCECLRDHKHGSNFSNKEIAYALDKPITLVEHWFRKDSSFSIPDAGIWYQLKELLGITTDEFDLQVTEFIEQDGVYEKANRCYMTDGIAPTITSASADEKIVEPMIVASRGRNPQNPSDRTPGADTEQRLEPNSEGICNTLTSVQKDNLVLEPRLVGGLGEKDWGKQWRQGNRVYDSNAVAMALNAQPVGNAGGNSYLYLVDETVKIKQATQQGYVECKLGGVADLSYPTSKTRRGRVQDNGDTCPTLTATETGICRIETPYRIRKLTPLECWRLMDFTDEDFYKAKFVIEIAESKDFIEQTEEKVNKILNSSLAESKKLHHIKNLSVKIRERTSNTQLYKQAGNSIVKAVLMAIFKQMM